MTGREARDNERETLEAIDALIGSVRWPDREPVVSKRVGGMISEALVAAGYRKHPEPEITDDEKEQQMTAGTNLIVDDDSLADSTVEIAGEIAGERIRAHRKHCEHSMEAWPAVAPERYLILAEEVGEVAKEFNDATVEGRPIDLKALRGELIQVATMAVAWVDAIDQVPNGEWEAVSAHEWNEITFSWGGYIECSCGYRPHSQAEMDAHSAVPVGEGEQ